MSVRAAMRREPGTTTFVTPDLIRGSAYSYYELSGKGFQVVLWVKPGGAANFKIHSSNLGIFGNLIKPGEFPECTMSLKNCFEGVPDHGQPIMIE